MMKIFIRENRLIYNRQINANKNRKEIYYLSHGIGRKAAENIKIDSKYKNKKFPILKIKYKRNTEITLFGKEFLENRQTALLIINNKKKK